MTLDLSFFDRLLQQPEVLMNTLLIWVGGFLIFSVLVWGMLEVWLKRREALYRASRRYVLLAIDVPKDTEQSPMAVEQIFTLISSAWGGPNFIEKWIDGEVAPIFSFELISVGGYIQYLIRVETKFRDMIEAGIYAQYPDAEITEAEDYTRDIPDKYPDDDFNVWGVEQKLNMPHYFPIKGHEMFEHRLSQELKDPLTLMLEQYGKLRPGEQLWTQILLQPLGPDKRKWAKAGKKYIYDEIGKEDPSSKKSKWPDAVSWIPGELSNQIGGMFGPPAEEKKEDPWKFLRSTPIDKIRLDLVAAKITKPGIYVKIRHVYVATHDAWFKKARDKALKGIYHQYTHLEGNEFGRVKRVTPKNDYFWQRWYADKRRMTVLKAFKNRDGEVGGTPFVLNTEELATIWHFPGAFVKPPFIKKTLAKRAEPPVMLPTADADNDILFGGDSESKSGPAPLPIDLVEPSVPTGRTAQAEPQVEAAPAEPQVEAAPAEPAPLEAAPEIRLPGQDVPTPSVPKPEPLLMPETPPVEPATRTEPPAPAAEPSPAKNTGQPSPDDFPDAIRALFDPDVDFKN